MAVLKTLALVAAVLFCLWAFFKVFQFIVRSWKAIEADEAERRRFPALRKRGGYETK